MDLSEEEFLYISSRTPLINVDLFIVNEYDEVLLSWRDDELCGTGWHIPGGIIRHGETMRDRLEKTAIRELGFIPEFEQNPCKITEIFLDQQYRDHFVSHLFKGRCKKTQIRTVAEPSQPGDLCWFNYFPGLVYSQKPYEDYFRAYFSNRKIQREKREI